MKKYLNVVKNVKAFSENRVKELPQEFAMKKVVCFPNDSGYKGMIAIKDMDWAAKCEHHQVGIRGIAHLAYIPSRYLVGLSQFGRVLEYFANVTVGITQEHVNKQISDYLIKVLKPKGLMLVLDAEHFCMSMRGVRQRNSRTVTSEVYGALKKNYNTRQEALRLFGL